MESNIVLYLNSNSSIKQRKYELLLFVYVVIVNILMIFFFKTTFKTNAGGVLFVYSFNKLKYGFSVFENIIMFVVEKRSVHSKRLTDSILLLITFLYFIPGCVQQAVTDAPWDYMLYYFLFWIGLQIWKKIIKPRNNNILKIYYRITKPREYITLMSIGATILIIFIMFYSGSFFSVSNLKATLDDIYGVRAASKESAMHWFVVSLEYWAMYFLMLTIAFFAQERKWILTGVCFFAELCVFMIQANRITLFLSVAALLSGLMNLNNRKISLALLILILVIFAEVLIRLDGAIITNVFRRYSVVPNRLSEQYFDYFKTHVPDLLRSKYDRLASLLGVRSPYISPGIGVIIGQEYYKSDMNGNSGLVAGGMFMFGYFAPIITTFGYIMAYRLFEGITYAVSNKRIIICLAIILATLSINTGTLLANLFSVSYVLFLYLSMIPLSCAFRKT